MSCFKPTTLRRYGYCIYTSAKCQAISNHNSESTLTVGSHYSYCVLQSSVVITRSHIVKCFTNDSRNWCRISIRCWNHKRHPYLALTGELREVCCEYLWEIDRVITGPHCISTSLFVISPSTVRNMGWWWIHTVFPKKHATCWRFGLNCVFVWSSDDRFTHIIQGDLTGVVKR